MSAFLPESLRSFLKIVHVRLYPLTPCITRESYGSVKKVGEEIPGSSSVRPGDPAGWQGRNLQDPTGTARVPTRRGGERDVATRGSKKGTRRDGPRSGREILCVYVDPWVKSLVFLRDPFLSDAVSTVRRYAEQCCAVEPGRDPGACVTPKTRPREPLGGRFRRGSRCSWPANRDRLARYPSGLPDGRRT